MAIPSAGLCFTLSERAEPRVGSPLPLGHTECSVEPLALPQCHRLEQGSDRAWMGGMRREARFQERVANAPRRQRPNTCCETESRRRASIGMKSVIASVSGVATLLLAVACAPAGESYQTTTDTVESPLRARVVPPPPEEEEEEFCSPPPLCPPGQEGADTDLDGCPDRCLPQLCPGAEICGPDTFPYDPDGDGCVDFCDYPPEGTPLDP